MYNKRKSELNSNNFCNTGTGRQMQPSRPQYIPGVYGQHQRAPAPFAVGPARGINGGMNSQSTLGYQNRGLQPNQSTNSVNTGNRNMASSQSQGQRGGYKAYNNTAPSKPAQFHQTRATFHQPSGTNFQQKPQAQPQMYSQAQVGQTYQSSVPVAQISLPEGQPGQVLTGNLPSELQNNPNVNYVNLKWEDILGGQGLGGLQVSMAPSDPGNPNQNRQIRIGMGGGDQNTNSDGCTPLKIVSFQPLENYPGKIDPTTSQNQLKTQIQFPKFQTGTWGQAGATQSYTQPQPQQCNAYQFPQAQNTSSSSRSSGQNGNVGRSNPGFRGPGNYGLGSCQGFQSYASRR